ncbi:MAG: phage virion morphogenesis protein [Alphaproteobacteria bacterium]|nr:phage virion morphogenesis protein [Alphaproteobacteria bacterium]
MSGVQAKLTIDTTPLKRVFAALRSVSDDPSGALDVVGRTLVSNTQLRFEVGAGPGGVPWVQSRRPKVQGGKTLVEHGLLRDSITHEVDGHAVVWGTNDIRAGIHQKGGTIVPKNGKALAFKGADGRPVFVQRVVMPARPFIGYDEIDNEDVGDVLVDVLSRLVGANVASNGGAA